MTGDPCVKKAASVERPKSLHFCADFSLPYDMHTDLSQFSSPVGRPNKDKNDVDDNESKGLIITEGRPGSGSLLIVLTSLSPSASFVGCLRLHLSPSPISYLPKSRLGS